MIEDLEGFLDFSESNMERQYRRKLQAIQREPEDKDFPREYLESDAEHRFKVSLPLRVRYGAVIALTTSVEWSVNFLVKQLKEPTGVKLHNYKEIVHAMRELDKRTKIGKTEVVSDYEALVYVRNCIAHNAGLEEHYRHPDKLRDAVKRLTGFTLARHPFLKGNHICIEKGALNPYIRQFSEFIVELYKAMYHQGLARNGA